MATRFGFGAGAVVNPSNPELAGSDVGLDLRFRVSKPLSSSLSLALDVGSFVFSAEDQNEWVVNPQAMVINTFGGTSRFPYVAVGVGAVLPAEQDRDGQFTVHAAFGWAWPFGSRTSFFVELNPSLAFREEGAAALVPLRAGLIF